MKKMFLAAITALALCSYSYAQDEDEYEYEEDGAPARVEEKAAPAEEEEEEEEAPAPKKVEKKAKKSSSSGGAFLGLGMGLTDTFNQLNLKFKLNESMMITAIFGLVSHGETTYTTTVAGTETEVDAGDDYTELAIGAGFDYFLPTPVLPTSAGIELIYASNGEKEDAEAQSKFSSSDLYINLMFGAHAEIVPNLILSGKVGFGIDWYSTEETAGERKTEASRVDVGIRGGIYATWFFL
ncbi:hypothetical protein [uncultured Fibrobacter sp.]|uniref:hypothetical protein n=1 Tax=uncultured Fibrobacter sp. TaxID=261512 RepID=UPI002615E845|nr:hypothetical protein [uncultured Fibrobacter sp.]